MSALPARCYIIGGARSIFEKPFVYSGAICYRPQRSWQGYVFTRVCHSVHGGRCYPSMLTGGIPAACLAVGAGGWVLSQHALQQGVCSQGGACSRGSTPRGGLLPGGSAPRVCVYGDPPAKAAGYCCGWYASYWNAFLLIYILPYTAQWRIQEFLEWVCLPIFFTEKMHENERIWNPSGGARGYEPLPPPWIR